MQPAYIFWPSPLQRYFRLDRREKVAFKEIIRSLRPHVAALRAQGLVGAHILAEHWAREASVNVWELERLIAAAQDLKRGSIARDALDRLGAELDNRGMDYPRQLQRYFRWLTRQDGVAAKSATLHILGRDHLVISAVSWLVKHREFTSTRNDSRFDAEIRHHPGRARG